ncbi:MAG: OmpA family protein [Gammaproteobacteria bacterium]|nr:OmpA family protein [Gammaproteobacteria bacterium]
MTQMFRATVLTATLALLPGGMATTAQAGDHSNPDSSAWPLTAWVSPPPDYRPAPRPYPPPYPSHYRQPPPEYNPAIDPRQLEADLVASRIELQRAHERLEATQALLQQAREALTINYAEYQQQRAAQTDQTEQLKAATVAVDAAQSRIAQLTDELKTVRAALDEQQARAADFAALEQEQAQTSGTLQQLRADITRLEEVKNKAESQYQSCQEQLATNRVDLDAAQANHTEAMQSLTEMRTERDRLQAELSNMVVELEKRRSALDSANASASAVIAERDALQARLADSSAKADQAETEQSAKLAEELKTAQTTLETELAAKTALQQALADAVSTRERLLAQVDTLNTRIAGSVAEEQSTQSLLQQQLTACNERLVAAKAALSAAMITTSETPADGTAKTYAVEMAAMEPAPVAAASVDRDADGIADSQDLCPASPASTAVDATGCAPDTPIALAGVHFKYDSDALTTPSRAALDQVAAILREQPALKLEVAGHSDTQGDAAYNLWLSEQRAKAVMAYLVSQGVPAERLSAQGYGGSQPIADNTTREGLARNRRVELRRQP